MNSDVPYLPIREFASRNQEELIKGLENESPETLVKRKGMPRYWETRDGYSDYVELILQGMGMEKYASLFEEEDISVEMLISMTNDDLVNLGITDSQERECMLQCLEQFQVENQELIKNNKESDLDEFEVIEDDIIMARNVFRHLVELNSYLAYIQFKLSRNPPKDYLICNYETGLKFFKFAINHAMIQSDRMSQLLFDRMFSGRNMINDALKVTGVSLPADMKEKLIASSKTTRKLKKRRIITTIVLGIGIVIAVTIITKK